MTQDTLTRTSPGNAPPPPAAPPAAAKPASPGKRPPGWAIALGAAVLAAVAYIYVPSLYAVETDDAAIQADTVTVTPKIAAYVSALYVSDNTPFSAGQLLVELDPRDFQVAVASAAANLAAAQAAQADVQAQLSEQAQLVAADQANLQGDRATRAFAQQELARFGQLAQDGAGTDERWQQAESDIGERQAALEHDAATLAAAQAQTDVLQSQLQQAAANAAHEQAALAQARLNLSYTKIYAQASGTVANRSVQAGNYVQPGQALFSAVPNQVYVIANFKETQLAHMRPGQPVSVKVDAFPGLTLHGHIDSFQRGTGSNFALLPPENATGNFVKIVQRIPVKILLDGTDKNLPLAAPGMSVEATVTIHAAPGWLVDLF